VYLIVLALKRFRDVTEATINIRSACGWMVRRTVAPPAPESSNLRFNTLVSHKSGYYSVGGDLPLNIDVFINLNFSYRCLLGQKEKRFGESGLPPGG
jgi:hypothetical protein